METWRKKQKRSMIEKNRKKIYERRDQALQKRSSLWLKTEIAKLNANERELKNLGRGSASTEKLRNKRKKYVEAYKLALKREAAKVKRQKAEEEREYLQNAKDFEAPPIDGYEIENRQK